MRLEIVVPDSTTPDVVARLITLTKSLSADPDLVNSFVLESPLSLNSEQLAVVRQSQSEMKAGLGMTPDQVRASLEDQKAEWLAANPS